MDRYLRQIKIWSRNVYDIYVHRDREVEDENFADESTNRLNDRIKSHYFEFMMREMRTVKCEGEIASVRVVSSRAP